MSNFINDYLIYNSGNECPLNYHRWSALTILAAAMSKRVWIDYGYFDVYPNLYVCLVGKQGNRKSVAKDIARDLFCEAFPDHPIGASVQSREDIVKNMASDDYERQYTDSEGVLVSHKPITFFINELKNFLSINPIGMIDFLTDIYDRKSFDASTIKHGLQEIKNPCVNVLACETPSWIIDKLKGNIITGGFSRRMIYVYEIEECERIPFPFVSAEARAARLRCLEHLRLLPTIKGKFTWEPAARVWFAEWYKKLPIPDDEVMEGYYRSKHIQLLKIAMGLAVGRANPKLILTREDLEDSRVFLDALETNLPKLSIAAGRNQLAVPMQGLLEVLAKNGGWLTEKVFQRNGNKDLTPMEFLTAKRYLQETEQIIVKAMPSKGNATMVMLPEKYAKETNPKLKT